MKEQKQEFHDKNMDIIQQELGNLPLFDLPTGFHNELMAKIRMQAAMRRAGRRRGVVKLVGSLAASIVVLVAAVLIFDNLPRQVHLDENGYSAPATFGARIDYPDAAMPPETVAGGANELITAQAEDLDIAEFNFWMGDLAFDPDSMPMRDFDIAIAVEDIAAVLYAIELLPGESWLWSVPGFEHEYGLELDDYGAGFGFVARTEVILTVDNEDFEWVIAALHGFGRVEWYAPVITATDGTRALPQIIEQDQDYGDVAWASIIATQSTIMIILHDDND